jgi:hypothetical protein
LVLGKLSQLSLKQRLKLPYLDTQVEVVLGVHVTVGVASQEGRRQEEEEACPKEVALQVEQTWAWTWA